MATFSENIEIIRKSIYGREMRQAIADALEQCDGATSLMGSEIETLKRNYEDHTIWLRDIQSNLGQIRALIASQDDKIAALEDVILSMAGNPLAGAEKSGDVMVAAYGNGDILVIGDGAATTVASTALQETITGSYSYTSRWRVEEGVTALCDSFLADVGAFVATSASFPRLYLPATLTQIGDQALPSHIVTYAGTMAQWRAIQNSGGSTITSDVFAANARTSGTVTCSDGTLQYNSGSSSWEVAV